MLCALSTRVTLARVRVLCVCVCVCVRFWLSRGCGRRAPPRPPFPSNRFVSCPVIFLVQARHLARHYAADLFLDAFAYGAHTTASDGLSSGLPMVALQGASFAARVSSSILHYADLDHLVTHSVTEYVDVATRLAAAPEVCLYTFGQPK
jgi:hypothetical protein